jgi:NAD(P)-dependent dehydrogenase (short-subunit alcohol dehydrogenase family)
MPMLMMQSKKTVLVTGASRGIGLAIARAIADRGYNVAIAVRDPLAGEQLAKEFSQTGGELWIGQVDLRSAESITEFCCAIDFPLWGVINNAGICSASPLSNPQSYDALHETLAVNLSGPYLLTQLLLDRITRPGRIINISSQLGLDGRAGYGAYCASKFGLIGLTKCWAKELGQQGITVNAVCPGWVSTEMSVRDIERLAAEAHVSPEKYYADTCSPLELKRFNTPEEVASLVCYLLSEDASGITGREMLMQTVWNQC